MAVDPRKFGEWMKFKAEYEAMLKPEIQAEYKKAMDAIAEWDKRRNYDQLASTLKQQQDEHKQTVADFQKERDKYTADMQQWHTGLTKQDADIKKRLAEVQGKESALASAQATYDSNAKTNKAALDKRSQELDKREKDLDTLQGILHKREVELSSKHDKVNAAVASLKSLQ